MIRRRFALWLLLLLFLGCARKQLGPPIYNEKANARQDIAAAIAHSTAGQENIVLIFGANW